MKKILLLTIIFLWHHFVLAQNTDITTFILIRHAEKILDNSNDPDLTKEGVERAEKFRVMFANTKIEAIYSTPYLRTQNTVKPLAILQNIEIQSYDPSSADFLNGILLKYKKVLP